MSPSTEQRENRALALELKFILPREAGAEIRAWARRELSPDPNAPGEENDLYQITSLYFDTPAWDVFQRNGSYGRSKYRIRRYGQNRSMFLERKLKTKGLVSKRRTLVAEEELRCLRDGSPDGWRGSWFQQRLALRKLQPVCQISYQRTARVTMSPSGPLRLTLDDDLRALLVKEPAFAPESEYEALLPESSILELKFRGEMPVIFKQLLQQFNLAPAGFSKYRLAVKQFGIASTGQPAETVIPAYA